MNSFCLEMIAITTSNIQMNVLHLQRNIPMCTFQSQQFLLSIQMVRSNTQGGLKQSEKWRRQVLFIKFFGARIRHFTRHLLSLRSLFLSRQWSRQVLLKRSGPGPWMDVQEKYSGFERHHISRQRAGMIYMSYNKNLVDGRTKKFSRTCKSHNLIIYQCSIEILLLGNVCLSDQ